MAQARSARSTAPAPRRRVAVKPLVLAGGRNVRWDRLGRLVLVLLLVGLAAMYVGPATSYFEAVRESRERKEQVRVLEARHDKLRARRDALRDPATLEREARRLGMVKPGERAYVIRGLPRD